MSELTARETEQVDAANTSGRTPAVFVHGLWLLAGCWERWGAPFEAAGFAPVLVDWPDDPESVEEANAHPKVMARKTAGKVAAHIADVIGRLSNKPVVIGHSFGGSIAEVIAGKGLSAATVAIDPAPCRGVLPLPISTIRSVWPVFHNPLNRFRAVPLTFDQFRYAFANAVDEQEALQLYETYAVPAPGVVVFQGANVNLNPWSELKADFRNPDRGPILLISGGEDHAVPRSMVKSAYKRHKRNPGVTEFKPVEGRGHSLVIDSGWSDICDACLEFLKPLGK